MLEYEAEVAALEAKFAGKLGGNVVFYGSSSIRLWPGLARAFPGIAIENLGFGGSTLEACAAYFERLVVPRAPRSVLVYAGDNDLALDSTPENVWNSLRLLLDAHEAHFLEIPLAFLSLKPSPAREPLRELIESTNEWCKRETWDRANVQWVEIFSPMLDEHGAPRSELYAPDELHLSRAGYELWNEVLRREIAWLNTKL
jgi:lysophospholipase L1-like esterase